VVKVEVQGASIEADRIKHLIPIFEEGSVDEDLLNEGNRRLRDYFQRLGYFDAKVDHQPNRRAAESKSTFFTLSSLARGAAWRKSPSTAIITLIRRR
jgi:outer membrane protein insertion porin family